VGACGAGMAGSEIQPYHPGDAGSGDPAYRAALRGRRTVPDACRLGLGRTVRHDPYRIGPSRGVGGRFEGGIEEAAYRVTLLAGWCAVGTVPSPGVCECFVSRWC